MLDIESIDDESHDENIKDQNSVKFLYRESTWNQEHFSYSPKPMEFMEVYAPNFFWHRFLIFFVVV